jgi:hypothetical protein
MNLQELRQRIDDTIPVEGWDREVRLQVLHPDGTRVWLPVVNADVLFVDGSFKWVIAAEGSA